MQPKSRLLRLPTELLVVICAHIDPHQDPYTLWQTNRRLRRLVADIIRKHPVLFFHAIDEERRPIRPSLLSILKDRAATFDENTLRNPFSFAAYKKDDTTCGMLLDVAENINAGIKLYSDALHDAATWGSVHVTELVLRAIPYDLKESEFKGYDYRTEALKNASGEGHEEVVKLLLLAGARVNDDGDEGISALQRASNEGHEGVVRLLLEAGSRVSLPGLSICGRRQMIVICGGIGSLSRAYLRYMPNCNVIRLHFRANQ
jgi:hypothetical protein